MTKKKAENTPAPEELEAMADALLADADKTAQDKPAKSKEERLNELVEKGKKTGSSRLRIWSCSMS